MKQKICILLFTILAQYVKAQQFNNEWIDYSKKYYKFKIALTGPLRIYKPVLDAAGLGNINADHFQLWRNGKELRLYTTENNAPLTANGYLEFWGEKNDGKPDKPMYREPEYQLDDYWSLQTDSASFFLTVNSATPNLRYTQITGNLQGNTLAPSKYCIFTQAIHYNSQINRGYYEVVDFTQIFSSSFETGGEGLISKYLPADNTLNYEVSNMNVYNGAGAPDAVIKAVVVGNKPTPRTYSLLLNNETLYRNKLDSFNHERLSLTVPVSKIETGTTLIAIKNLGPALSDRMAVASTSITYPKKFIFDDGPNFIFKMPPSSAGNYLEIEKYNHGGLSPIIYDTTNGYRYLGDHTQGNTIKAKLLPSAVERTIIFFSSSPVVVNSITKLTEKNFVKYNTPEHIGDYLIISNPVLTAASGGDDPVADYKQYRSSAVGGSYIAKTYMIDELEDQFAFGIKRSPLSIRNFLFWARERFNIPIKQVLLIGRGIVYNERNVNTDPEYVRKLDLVPTFGHPASDVLLGARGNSSKPYFSIGRISAVNKTEISNYLAKVKEYELVLNQSSTSIEDKAWQKNVVHIGGGSDLGLNAIIRSTLDNASTIIEGDYHGGKVYPFYKNSATVVEDLDNTYLSSLFAQGIGLLTYFGHSSANTFDYNLDFPEKYNNAGKYPVFNIIGCDAGNFFGYYTPRLLYPNTLSEKYTLAKQAGCIAFLSSSSITISNAAQNHLYHFYTILTKELYGATLGEIKNEALNKVFSQYDEHDNSHNSFYSRLYNEQFLMQGDPALRLYNFSKPDFAIESEMIQSVPTPVSTSDNKFKLNFNIRNLGRTTVKMPIIQVWRTYPDLSSELIITDTLKTPLINVDSFSYELSINPSRDKGINKFEIIIDAENSIDELHETNNKASKDLYIIDNGVTPIYPYNYAIVNKNNIKLYAYVANLFAPQTDYLMEIDTTGLFNSPLKQMQVSNSLGGLLEFTPSIQFKDSAVYYWRVAVKPENNNPTTWNQASFTYIANSSEGFMQSHYYQMLENKFGNLSLDPASRKFVTDEKHHIFIRSGVFPTGYDQERGFSVAIDGDNFIRGFCARSSIVFNVINPNNGTAWFNANQDSPGQYGSESPCKIGTYWDFRFNILDPNKRKKMCEFLNQIPDGYYVIVRNNSSQVHSSNTYAEDWKKDSSFLGKGNTLYDILKGQGFETIDSFNKPMAFIFVYRKNTPFYKPTTAFSVSEYLPVTLSVDITTSDSVGYLYSNPFGPARKWKELHWQGKETGNQYSDQPKVDLIGISLTGAEAVLIKGIPHTQQNLDISHIDAAKFPFLKLKLKSVDEVYYTPYQLKYWRLNYDPLPEGAIRATLPPTAFKDSINAGDAYSFEAAFKNIGIVNFDSVKVKFSITNSNNQENIYPIARKKPMRPNDTISVKIPINTTAFANYNRLFLNFNPDNDQPEHYLFNNFAFKNIYVTGDKTAPLLDVTFDGVHILNNDIVSAKPNILITIKDDSKHLLLRDTAALNIQIRYPDGTIKPVNFSNNGALQFIPATAGNNEATVMYNPHFFEDGVYELIVSGKDASNNKAGQAAYRVTFEVNNKPMISNLLNYPNPFTTSTAFVFTLTGVELPQTLRIQILTATGKVVKEINKEELGPIHIGRNITEYKWDGTDMFGQKLANGVYLYRVITNLKGNALEKYTPQNSNTDKYFNKGYGKMVLIR